MAVFMTNQDPFARPSHAVFFVVFLKTLEASKNGGVFLRLVFFGAKGVV